jgi:hypothetical protein
MMENKLVEVARKYIGQTEKPGNAGFTDSGFEAKMKAVGFHKGDSWCSYMQELNCKEAYPEKFAEFDKLFSANANKTFENFRDESYPVAYKPQVGYLVFWVLMKDDKPVYTVWNNERWYHGHIGVVSEVAPDGWHFKSIEGNTNDVGGREGYIVAERQRVHLAEVKNGLKITGFVNPAIQASKPFKQTI